MELIGLPQQEPEKKAHWFSDPEKIKVLAAFLAVIAAVLNVFGRSQKTTWILAAAIGILLLSILAPLTVQRVKKFTLSKRNRGLVEREHKKLERYFERFSRMCTDRNYTRSFLCILYSASAYQPPVVLQVIGADYISSWVACLERQIKTPCHSLKGFLARCSEFCVIVRNFNTDYVIRAQKGLDEVPRLPKETFEQFEAFREDFTHLLRDIEEWTDALNKEASHQLTTEEQIQIQPVANFERAKPFVWKSLGAKNASQ